MKTLIISPDSMTVPFPHVLADMRRLYDRTAPRKTQEEFLKEVHHVSLSIWTPTVYEDGKVRAARRLV